MTKMTMDIIDFHQIGKFEWEISASYESGMRVPVILFADVKMIKECLKDASIQQAINAAKLPGVIQKVCVMPDIHQGYGFPIGGVAATSVENGIISPGAIGYDINCGVRLMTSDIDVASAAPYVGTLIDRINALCPSGVGKGGQVNLKRSEVEEVCINGAFWAAEHGYALGNEMAFIEDQGRIVGADPSAISSRAIQRGMPQLGSLGAGNHFIEVDVIEEIYQEGAAAILGLQKGNIVFQLHSGSRGLGHQVCSDYVKDFQRAVDKYKYNLPDRELACAPLQSKEGKKYLSAMRCAANYAFANRQILASYVRQAFAETFLKISPKSILRTTYDLAHNIGKIEMYEIDGRNVSVCVHRKGATRAFGPGHKDIPAVYKKIGQPILIPGSMGTSSWVMVGTNLAAQKSFSSCSHGAGRVMSRSKARKSIRGEQVREELAKEGIKVRAGSIAGLAEEAPQAYKDVNRVIKCIEGAELARKVARLKPLAVIKG